MNIRLVSSEPLNKNVGGGDEKKFKKIRLVLQKTLSLHRI